MQDENYPLVFDEDMFKFIKYKIQTNCINFNNLYEITEGLENKLIKEITSSNEEGLRIKAVGDICLPSAASCGNRAGPLTGASFDKAKGLLKGHDILVGNLEGAVTDKTQYKVSKAFNFCFTPGVSPKTLIDNGFDIVNLANNHIRDYSQVGHEDTIADLNAAKLPHFGAKNQIEYLNVKGKTVAFVGFYGNNKPESNSPYDKKELKRLITEAEKKADITVVSFHGGSEGQGAMHIESGDSVTGPSGRSAFIDFAHNAVDAGADCVLGSHPHVLRAMELYKGKLIAYSLGNFVGTGGLSVAGRCGQSAVLDISLDDNGNFQSGRILPVRLNPNNYRRPEPDSSPDSAIQILQRLTNSYYEHFNIPKNLEISDDGTVRPVIPFLIGSIG